MTEPIYVPEDEMTTATGLGKIQLRNDIAAGLLPGRLRGRKPQVLRAEWNAYITREWKPRPAQPVGIVNIHERKAS